VITEQKENVHELAQRTARAIYGDFIVGTVRRYVEDQETVSVRFWPAWRRTIAGALNQVVFGGATESARIYGVNSAERRVIEALFNGLEGNLEYRRLVCAGILEFLIAEERVDLLLRADAGAQPSERTVTMNIGELQSVLRTVNQTF